jgi:hypothetical protein
MKDNSKLGLFILIVTILVVGLVFSYKSIFNKNQPVTQMTTTDVKDSSDQLAKNNKLDQEKLMEESSDIEIKESQKPEPNSEAIRFESKTGYSFAYPSKYKPMKTGNLGQEHLSNNLCEVVFTEGGFGGIVAKVVPNSGNSLKERYLEYTSVGQGYKLTTEEAIVAGRKALIIEAGTLGDSGSGTGVIIPFTNNSLIIQISYLGSDNPEVTALFRSIKARELNLSLCGKQAPTPPPVPADDFSSNEPLQK